MEKLIENLQNFDAYSLIEVTIIIIILILGSFRVNKIIKDFQGHRYREIRDKEKEKMCKATENYVNNHKDEFVRKHYGHFARAFKDGAKWQKNKALN
jgi:hypothetical protein